MNQILTLARKELRAYFLSPVALIFLGTFLFVVLFSFFWVDTFFRRNIADVRPLFHWLPILLIFLVAALTMKLWSEEQRTGTLEVLLTLPIKIHRLVLGKFFAGLGLVAVALLLTFGLPLTVSWLGDLDWGPVIGGYFGALLLASTYLAIGLCISSSTDNPIVSLISTCVACGILYLIGSDAVAAFAGNRWTEILHALGSGSRFESIQRGVLDLRDLLYYLTLTASFLTLNTVILMAKRWSQGSSTRGKRFTTKLSVTLIIGNLLIVNVNLASVRSMRLDMTQRKEYSISPVTKKILEGLDAPLIIRGYFSEKTHPLLAPLVPRIRDLVQEYSAVGGDKVVTQFLDPKTDPAAEKEANEDYGIKSVPFQFADRHEAAVVNSYFNLLIKYGDKHETLGFEDLIEVKVTGMRDIEVKLRNLEYDLTRTIKKVVYGFQPLESVFSRTSGKVTLTAYMTPKQLPKNYQEVPDRLKKVAQEIQKRSSGRFEFNIVDPSGDDKEPLRRSLYEKYGFKPLAVSLFSDESFYLHLLLQVGDKMERVYPAPDMSEADLKSEITASLKRMTPGFLKTIGLVLPDSEQQAPPNPMMRRPMNNRQHEMLRAKLSETYSLRNLDLKDGRVPGDIDVLLLVSPQAFNEKQRFAVDQYLMRGGSVLVCGGGFILDTSAPTGFAMKPVKSGLEEMLASWGVKVLPSLVLDPQNEAFPVPVARNVMGMTVQEMHLINYPFFVDVRQDGMAENNPIISGLPSVTMQWVSPLEIKSASKDITITPLLRSSNKSWIQENPNVQPDFDKYPEKGFASEGETKSRVLAASLTGSFTSAFQDKPSPLFADEQKAQETNSSPKKENQAGRTIKTSPKTARLVVVGSADFLNDLVLNLSRQTGSERFTNNLQMVQNLVDWSVADIDLLSIRSRGSYARTLKPMEEATRSTWEAINYGLVIAALLTMVIITLIKRRSVQPMKLFPPMKSAEDNL